MMKCDVCNKSTLLPEKLGNAILCKKCFLKVNGFMWKYRKMPSSKVLEKNWRKEEIKF